MPVDREAVPASQRLVAVGLARASTDQQEHSVSDQRTEIERWCAANGHELLRTFDDDGVSGSKLTRPGLNALLSFVQTSKQKGTVVIWRRNRLARPDDPRDGLILERQIERAGWKLQFLHGAQQSGNALVDTLMATIEHHQGGEYLRTLATDSVRGVARRVLEGKVVIGPPPYGYAKEVTWPNGTTQVVPRTTRLRTSDATAVRLVPGDPKEIEVVRRIFLAYAQDVAGCQVLVQQLNREELPAPQPGKRWGSQTILKLVRNPVYRGDFVWNRRTDAKFVGYANGQPHALKELGTGKRVENAREDWVVLPDHHAALVERDQWERANAVMTRRAGQSGARRRPRAHALSGLLRCGNCGFTMTGWSMSCGNGRRYTKYVCTSVWGRVAHDNGWPSAASGRTPAMAGESARRRARRTPRVERELGPMRG